MSKKSIVAIGVFDGVHQGHRHIFGQVVKRAREINKISVAYTFDPHPAKILVPSSCPLMINTLPQRVRLIQKTGIQKVVVQKFTKSFAKETPEKFFKEVIVKSLNACEVFVGYNFTYSVADDEETNNGYDNNPKIFGRKIIFEHIHIVYTMHDKIRLMCGLKKMQ